jgi:hypothetical protein
MSPRGLLDPMHDTTRIRFCVPCWKYVVPVLCHCMFCGAIVAGWFGLFLNEFEIPVRQEIWQLAPDPAAHTHPRPSRT